MSGVRGPSAPETGGRRRAGVHIPLPMAKDRARVPAHVAAAPAPGDAGSARRSAGSVGGAPATCHAPFDPSAVPAGALPLWNALRDVRDPELPISVVDMGLIYDVRREGGTVEVTLTYTATGCPCVDFIRTDVTQRLLEEPGVEAVELREVWSPPWTRAMMTERGRAELRALGVAA